MDVRAANPKRVLVTGSTGAIGEPLAQYLLQRGHTVRGFARRPSPGLDDYVMGDLNDRDKVRAVVQGMDTIVHLARIPTPPTSSMSCSSPMWWDSTTFVRLPSNSASNG